MDEKDILERLRRIVGDAIVESSEYPDVEIDDRTFLPDILDSDGLTLVIVMMEEEWGFEVKDDEIELKIFEDIISLKDFVTARVDGAG